MRDGTLAPLQATGLSAADIVLGKLLASWAASLAFLAVALPFVVIAYFDGSIPALAMVTVIAVLAVELLVVCALGLGWSALTARTSASAVLTYTTVAVLVAVLPIVFGLLSLTYTEDVTITQRSEVYYSSSSAPAGAMPDPSGDYVVCHESTYSNTVARTDRLWWLLAVNPYVIVADSAPSAKQTVGYGSTGMLAGLKQAVREARLGPNTYVDYCNDGVTPEEQLRRDHLDGVAARVAVGTWRAGVAWLGRCGARGAARERALRKVADGLAGGVGASF